MTDAVVAATVAVRYRSLVGERARFDSRAHDGVLVETLDAEADAAPTLRSVHAAYHITGVETGRRLRQGGLLPEDPSAVLRLAEPPRREVGGPVPLDGDPRHRPAAAGDDPDT